MDGNPKDEESAPQDDSLPSSYVFFFFFPAPVYIRSSISTRTLFRSIQVVKGVFTSEKVDDRRYSDPPRVQRT